MARDGLGGNSKLNNAGGADLGPFGPRSSDFGPADRWLGQSIRLDADVSPLSELGNRVLHALGQPCLRLSASSG
jgi:hypothetical protein